jgi:hypothetical protein
MIGDKAGACVVARPSLNGSSPGFFLLSLEALFPFLKLSTGQIASAQPEGNGDRHRCGAKRQAESQRDDLVSQTHLPNGEKGGADDQHDDANDPLRTHA